MVVVGGPRLEQETFCIQTKRTDVSTSEELSVHVSS